MSRRSSSSSVNQKPTKSDTSTTINITQISTPKPPNYAPTHHINRPPTSFQNPWPSSPPPHSLKSILTARFLNNDEKHYVPIPTDRSLLVANTPPTWGHDHSSKLKATWIGHASFLVELPSPSSHRGLRILFDPVFSTRMSPVSFLGPLRFTPPACPLEELPEVDVVCISHNHYDHLDAATIQYIHARGRGSVRFCCPLGVSEDLVGMGVQRSEIVEMDWWDCVGVSVEENGMKLGQARLICTPSQHTSGRGVWDHGKTLWCSWTVQEVVSTGERVGVSADEEEKEVTLGKRLFFAGDTAYRAVPKGATEEEISKLPVCTAFREIGELFGPFDLALLPIGCYSPRWWMSAVHCAPEDSICIHQDIRSRKSIGMHYGTIRGGISQYYEEVTEPPRRWKEACEKAGLKWQDEIDVTCIGGTVVV